MLEAILYDVDNAGDLQEECRLSMKDGEIVVSNNHWHGKLILGIPIADWPSGMMVSAKDGEAFLRALPAAYSGSRFRIGLDES